jgi:c-di-GMP-binding flagellar brake protein YcgR
VVVETNARRRGDRCVIIGDRVEIGGGIAPSGGRLESRVLDVKGDSLVIALPQCHSWTEAQGRVVRVTKKTDLGIFTAAARVLADGISFGHVLTLGLVEGWQHVQRRNDVRLPASIPVKEARLLSADEPTNLDLTTLNISASGCLLRSVMLVPLNSRLRLSLQLPDSSPPLEVEAVVVRLEADAPGPLTKKPPASRIGVRFLSLPRRDQDRIVRFIFREQTRRIGR